MVLIPTFTEEYRQRELMRGRRSLFYFGVSILGFCAPDSDGQPLIGDVHRRLAEFLEGRPPHNHPWRRALVCTFRGGGKSTWTTITYPLWRGLYIPNFSTKLIENSSDNAKRHHFVPIIELLTSSPRADYLQWLYSHRIPTGFAGTNSEQLKLIQTDPLANPTLSYWGIESRFEGAHPDLVVLDDPEGADAEKSLVPNREAWTAYQSCIPLLKDPRRSQILIVATPHGEDPIVWKLRDREFNKRGWQGAHDNARPDGQFKIFWQPLLNERGGPAWPEKFPLDICEELLQEEVANTQYMLRRSNITISLFNMESILGTPGDPSRNIPPSPGSCFEFVRDESAVTYPGFDYDHKRLKDPHYKILPPTDERGRRVLRTVNLRDMRYYLHFDPKHRALEARKSPAHKQRPAEGAALVVGITPDFHPVVVDYWTGDGDIDKQLDELFRLYRKWAPVCVTYEGVGAQVWLTSLVAAYEKQSEFWRNPYSTTHLGSSISLARLSTRLVEADKTNEAKEWLFREGLSSWVNRGVLHFHRTRHDVLLYQLANVLNNQVAVDLVDCLAQGPTVWAPPIASDRHARRYGEAVAAVEAKLRQVVSGATSSWKGRSGYRRPWSGEDEGRRGGGRPGDGYGGGPTG